LYNSRMAAHGVWEVLDLAVHQLGELARIAPDRPLLMDSIWLSERYAAPFLDLIAGGRRVGLMLHSFPSLIHAAEQGEPTPEAPNAFELQALARLQAVVVPGQHYARWLPQSGPRPPRLVVADPGLDDGWRAPPRVRQGPCRLVSVGAVTPRKGFLDVAEILASPAFAGRDYRWQVLGSLDVDRQYAEQLRARVASLSHVELVGQLPPEEVQRRVRSADVLLMPSYDENQPLVLLEALAASVPSIAYAAGAARQMIEHETEGLISEIGDREHFAEFLARLVDDEAERQALAAACWQRQQQLPSWPQAAQRAQQALAEAFARE
jgi:glycosyltransferase involved in cell wall biosynthesis